MSVDAHAIVRAQSLVAPRVERMVALLEQRGAGMLERLRFDATEELALWGDLVMVPLDAVPPTACAIAGVYLANQAPPKIGIWRQLTKPRAQFTALHELGHHLQQTDPQLIDELDGEPDEGAYLEERTSDAFAARILLPPEMIRRTLGAATPTAAQVVNLWRESGASRAAVCVAAAQQLASPGHVVLLDERAIVQFSASFGEFPLRRGSDQSSSGIMRARARTALQTTTATESRFVYRDGIGGTPLYAQATDIGGYTLVVAVAHGAPWQAMSLPSVHTTIAGRWQTCGHCEEVFQVYGVTCDKCGWGYCPECGKCDCESRVAEIMCTGCWLLKPAQLFSAGSQLCNECAS